MSPSEFISVAEESGLICRWGVGSIEEVCRQLKRWESAGVPVPRVAINVAAAHFRQPGFHDSVRSVLQSHSVDPGLIELELTERSLMEDTEGTRECLHALKDIGVRLAIDDFGAGHSGLERICGSFRSTCSRSIASFVSDLDTNKDAQVICSAILSIAHGFSLDAVADGIKSEQQVSFLTRNDCLYGQGVTSARRSRPIRSRAMMVESGGQATRRRRVTRKRIAAKAG